MLRLAALLCLFAVGSVTLTCSVIADRVVFNRAEWEARQRLADHVWPVLVAYIDADPGIDPEDRDRLMLAIGALLLGAGRIHVEDATRPEVIRAKARTHFAESSYFEMVRLTGEVRNSAELNELRQQMDAATMDALRELTGRH